MKKALRVFLFTVAFTVLLVPVAFAQSASGAFKADSDGGTRKVEFHGKVHPNGRASGEVKFEGPLAVPEQDVDGDGTGDPVVTAATLTMRIDVDCVEVKENRATLAGQVRESSVPLYVGRRMLLTVEDGGEGSNSEPDRYTWGQYRSTAATWVASDAELIVDPGIGRVWVATDFERTDDDGISSSVPAGIDCKSFPLSSYALEDLPKGNGNIQVKP